VAGMDKFGWKAILAQTGKNLAKKSLREGTEEAIQAVITRSGEIMMGEAQWGQLVKDVGIEAAAGAAMGFLFDAGGVQSFIDARAEVLSAESRQKVIDAFSRVEIAAKEATEKVQAELEAEISPEARPAEAAPEAVAEAKPAPEARLEVEPIPEPAAVEPVAEVTPEVVPEVAEAPPVEPPTGTFGQEVTDSGAKQWYETTRKAAVHARRGELGLEKVPSPSRLTFAESVVKAREQKIPDNALRIADMINTTPRALSMVETAGMTEKLAMLRGEHEALLAELRGNEDDASVAALSAVADRIEQEFDSVYKAVLASGTEKGRALVSQKLALNQNYDLVSVKTRAKAAKGKVLTEAESNAFQELTNKYSEAVAKADALQARIDNMAAQRAIKSGSKRYAAMSKTAIELERTSLVKDVRALLEAGC